MWMRQVFQWMKQSLLEKNQRCTIASLLACKLTQLCILVYRNCTWCYRAIVIRCSWKHYKVVMWGEMLFFELLDLARNLTALAGAARDKNKMCSSELHFAPAGSWLPGLILRYLILSCNYTLTLAGRWRESSMDCTPCCTLKKVLPCLGGGTLPPDSTHLLQSECLGPPTKRSNHREVLRCTM